MIPIILSLALLTIPAAPTGLTVVELEPIEQAARWAQSMHGHGPGYIIGIPLEKDVWIVRWYPRPLRPFGTCDDDDDCEAAVQSGCEDAGHDGPVTDVSQNGCICSGVCGGDSGAHYFEICNNPGC